MPYCLSLACNDIDFFLQVEVVLLRELLDGVGGEFSELHGKKLINCDKLEDRISPTWMLTMEISSGDVLFVRMRCMTRSEVSSARLLGKTLAALTLQLSIKSHFAISQQAHLQRCIWAFLCIMDVGNVQTIHRCSSIGTNDLQAQGLAVPQFDCHCGDDENENCKGLEEKMS